jgi:hypothetical protein
MKPTPGIAEDHPCGGSFVGFRVSAFPGGIALNARITKSLMISRPASSSMHWDPHLQILQKFTKFTNRFGKFVNLQINL